MKMLIWVHVQFNMLYALKKEDKRQFLDNLEKWNCNMDHQTINLITTFKYTL